MQPRLLPLGLALLSVGCVARVYDLDGSQEELCGGAVCFAPHHVGVRKWGRDEITVTAWRSEGADRCRVPEAKGDDKRDDSPVGGIALELVLHAAKPGARIPLVGRDQVEREGGWARLRVKRIEGTTGRPLADEEAVGGEATVLDLDPASGRVRVRARGKWSSGVSGEVLLDVPGPTGCGT